MPWSYWKPREHWALRPAGGDRILFVLLPLSFRSSEAEAMEGHKRKWWEGGGYHASIPEGAVVC